MRTLSPSADRIGDTKAELGESVCWDAEGQAVYWVDITGRKVLVTDPATGATDAYSFAEQTPFVQPCDDGTCLVGQQGSILRFDRGAGSSDMFVGIEADDPTTRTNDAGCDRQGRLFVTTMRMPPQYDPAPVGSLYQLFPDRTLRKIDTGLYIGNGIAFSPDGRTAYWADTYKTRRQIWQADYDPSDGALSAKRPFAQLPDDLGRPDGAAVDADGCYWVVAAWGWRLLRYTPAGELDLVVKIPVQRPSKLVFGGSDLKTIYVTSISQDLETPERQPDAGYLLAVDVGVQGLPPDRFAASKG